MTRMGLCGVGKNSLTEMNETNEKSCFRFFPIFSFRVIFTKEITKDAQKNDAEKWPNLQERSALAIIFRTNDFFV